MRVSAVRLLQSHLADLGLYEGKIDGDRGPKTRAAVRAALGNDPKAPEGWRAWSSKRQAVAVIQIMCHAAGIDAGKVDGWWGPQTEYAFDALTETRETGRPARLWRDFRPGKENPNDWPGSGDADLERHYGPHGLPGGRTPPLARVACPWTMRLAWDQRQTVSRLSIHEKCAQSLERVLGRVFAEYGEERIEALNLHLFGGSYNPRRMRGGSRWSTHSWAIALDFDPENNQLKWGRDRAAFARPDYDAWWRIWEEEGWVGLGRHRNFDWMHIQAARL